MYSKLKKWFELKGKELAELKIKGGSQLLKKKSQRDLSKFDLNIDEIMEFCTLAGQMDGVIWALKPDDPNKVDEFHQNVNKFFAAIEKECYIVKEMTGKVRLPKVEA